MVGNLDKGVEIGKDGRVVSGGFVEVPENTICADESMGENKRRWRGENKERAGEIWCIRRGNFDDDFVFKVGVMMGCTSAFYKNVGKCYDLIYGNQKDEFVENRNRAKCFYDSNVKNILCPNPAEIFEGLECAANSKWGGRR